jgi:uncharacterized membrane protein
VVTIAAFLFIAIVVLWCLTWPFRSIGKDISKIADASADNKRYKRLSEVPEAERTEEQKAALEQIQARREAAFVKGLVLLVLAIAGIVWMLIEQQKQRH